MLPQLNLDSHTASLFPPEAQHGRTQATLTVNFSDNGEARSFFARLIPLYKVRKEGYYRFGVALRPQGAEENRIFIAEIPHYNEAFAPFAAMTLDQMDAFDWTAYENALSSLDLNIYRSWSPQERKDDWTITIERNGRATAFWQPQNYSIFGEKVRFRCIGEATMRHRTMTDFFDLPSAELHETLERIYQNPESEMRYAMNWLHLSEEQKNNIAFACANGDWQQLREVAAWVLTVRLGRERYDFHSLIRWDFPNYGYTRVTEKEGEWNLWEDEFLYEWRAALTSYFEPDYVKSYGSDIGLKPDCVIRHIDFDNQAQLHIVQVPPPTAEALLRAQHNLEQWARQNLPEDEANQLLDF